MSNAKKFWESCEAGGHFMPRTPGCPRGGKSAQRKRRREITWQIFEGFIRRILELWTVHQQYVHQPVPSYPSSSSRSLPVTSQSTYSWKESAERLGIPFRETVPEAPDLDREGGVDDVNLVEIESGDSEGELETVEPWALPDLSQVNRLAETKSWVQEVRFELPVDIPGGGVCLVNRQAFANLDQDQEKSDSELFEEVLGALRLAICFDLFKTPSLADWTHAHVVLEKHRGQVQVIDRRVAELLQNLAYQDFKHCGITYIGRRSSEQYIESLSQSCILSLIPVVFVVFERPSKANIARKIDAVCAFDDQVQNIESYRRAGVFAVQVDRRGCRQRTTYLISLAVAGTKLLWSHLVSPGTKENLSCAQRASEESRKLEGCIIKDNIQLSQ